MTGLQIAGWVGGTLVAAAAAAVGGLTLGLTAGAKEAISTSEKKATMDDVVRVVKVAQDLGWDGHSAQRQVWLKYTKGRVDIG